MNSITLKNKVKNRYQIDPQISSIRDSREAQKPPERFVEISQAGLQISYPGTKNKNTTENNTSASAK